MKVFEIKSPLGSQYRSRQDYPFDAGRPLAGSWSAYTPRPRGTSCSTYKESIKSCPNSQNVRFT